MSADALYTDPKLAAYRRGDAPVPSEYSLWPLYGSGFESLGLDGQAIKVSMPQYGPDELLVRHDACGLCASDIKVIQVGEEHPRIYRDMKTNPVVLGHEVVMTVVGVGQNLRDQYRVGDRFIIQADIYYKGLGLAYGYEIQGGLSQYGVIDQRVLNGDDGNYLIPVQPDTGYAESAITEPWACVIAAYQLAYRTGLKSGGISWFIGTGGDGRYTISKGLDEDSHPVRLLLTDVPGDFAGWLRTQAESLGIDVVEVDDITALPVEQVDDIILLGADPNLIEKVSPRLAHFGIVAVVADKPLSRKVNIDIGRVHYNRWTYVGGPGPDIARAYSDVPVRSSLKLGGRAWFVGSGGAVGRMHVQRAIQIASSPSTIVCTDISASRLDDLRDSFAAEAEAKGISFICLNPRDEKEYVTGMAPFREGGFDDIVFLVSVPVPVLITEAAIYLAPRGVLNVFAGWPRGTMASVNLSDVFLKDVRIIGHSASTIDDLRLMLHQAGSGTLRPNRSVAAVGSLSAARDGLQAVKNTIFPGKIVIYPNIRDFPLTAVPDLEDKLPSVYAKLKNGREWTVEAEAEFLKELLP